MDLYADTLMAESIAPNSQFNNISSIILWGTIIIAIIIIIWAYVGSHTDSRNSGEESFDEAPKIAQRMFNVDDDYTTYFWNIHDAEGNNMYDYVYESVLQKNYGMYDDGRGEYPLYPGEDVGIIAYGQPVILSQFTLPSH